jgi:hypothetical protein
MTFQNGKLGRRVLCSPHGDSRVLVAGHDLRIFTYKAEQESFEQIGALNDMNIPHWKVLKMPNILLKWTDDHIYVPTDSDWMKLNVNNSLLPIFSP